MSKNRFDEDVARRSRSTNQQHFVHTETMMTAREEDKKCHPTLDPLGKTRECRVLPGKFENPTPIVIAMDVTRSRGDDARLVHANLPEFIMSIQKNGPVEDPEVCFAAVGDAKSDRAPIQIGQFETDNRMDDHLENIWLEEGGGGSGQESYELMAWYFANRIEVDVVEPGKKGFFFFFGDEGFYPQVCKREVERIFGVEIPEDLKSHQVFQELQKHFHVFLIYPKKSWEERKADIDEEIRLRVEAAGGMMNGVDMRFSLIWQNRNDLDLHVRTPRGEHIYYGSKHATCGGKLDVDQNISGENPKPVENTRWAKGECPRGNYKVWVENYGFHNDPNESGYAKDKDTPFKVEIDINGNIEHFEGVAKAGKTGDSSAVEVGTFFYDPTNRPIDESEKDKYAGYDDSIIKKQWGGVIPPEHILTIEDPSLAVDLMLGTLALVSGNQSLEEFMSDIEDRTDDPKHRSQIENALADLAELSTSAIANIPAYAGGGGIQKRKTNSSRL